MFPKDVETIPVSAADDLMALLDRADDHPLVLERDGVRYALNREDVMAYYDPEAAREAMRTAGKPIGLDVEEMLERIDRRRRARSKMPIGS